MKDCRVNPRLIPADFVAESGDFELEVWSFGGDPKVL